MATASVSAVETKRFNKSAFVRKVLGDIGALTENPPEGWRKNVEEALNKQGMEMHQVSIYQVRHKAMNKSKKPVKISRKSALAENSIVKNAVKNGSKNGELMVSDLVAIQEFSKTYGGINGLQKAINTIKFLGN